MPNLGTSRTISPSEFDGLVKRFRDMDPTQDTGGVELGEDFALQRRVRSTLPSFGLLGPF
jgi:hypothetical protein